MIEKLKAFFDLFRKGEAVADPVRWKKRQIKANEIGILLAAAAHVAELCGFPLPFSATDFDTIGGAILLLANWMLTYTTSEKVGILPPKPENRSEQSPGAGDINGA